MNYSSKSYLDTLGSISLLNSFTAPVPVPVPITTKDTNVSDSNTQQIEVDLGTQASDSINVNLNTTLAGQVTITYKNGVINGMYNVKVKLNNNIINLSCTPNLYNLVNTSSSMYATYGSYTSHATYAIIKINVLSDDGSTKLYFVDISYYKT
jgi:hypothetical protein